MPKACIYVGFRHLFYKMALFVGGVIESFMWFEIKISLTQENMDSILITKIARRAYK